VTVPGRIAADSTPAAGAGASPVAGASAASTLVFHVERLPIRRSTASPWMRAAIAPDGVAGASHGPCPRLASPALRSAPGWRVVLAWPLLALLWIYRHLVSPALPPACRYHPSCSQYAVEAVTLHGPLRGAWLAVRRLLRCHPWAPGGPDPVPPARVRPDPERVPK
jgi:putative membrane protein insertion efficiency factor